MKSIKIMLLGIGILLVTILIHLYTDGSSYYCDLYLGGIGIITVVIGLFIKTDENTED